MIPDLSQLVLSSLKLEDIVTLYRCQETYRGIITSYLNLHYLPIEVVLATFPPSDHEWDWEIISSFRLTSALIEKHSEKWHWFYLSANDCIGMDIINKYSDQIDRSLNNNSSLPYEIIDERIKYVDWDYLSSHLTLTPFLIERYYEHWNWDRINLNQSLTIEIVKQIQDKIDWEEFSGILSLTREMIDSFVDQWDWDTLSDNHAWVEPYHEQEILDFINKHAHRWEWDTLLKNPSLPFLLLKFYPHTYEEYDIDKWDWDMIAKHAHLDSSVIKEYNKYWDWDILSSNPYLTPEIIRDYQTLWNWDELSANYCLTSELVDEFYDKWNWRNLFFNMLRRNWKIFLDHPEYPWEFK